MKRSGSFHIPRSKNLPYGFIFGSATVSRLYGDEKTGDVGLQIETTRARVELCVTREGVIKVFKPVKRESMRKPKS